MSEVTGLTLAESITKPRPSRGAAAVVFVVAILAAALGSWADTAASRVHLGQAGEPRPWATTTDVKVRPTSVTSGVDLEAGEPGAVSPLPSAAASLREDHGGDVPKSALSRGAELRAKYGSLSPAELHQRINLRGVVEAVEKNALAAVDAAQGVSPLYGRLGTRAHTIFERLNLLTNQRIAGTGFRIVPEEFRLASLGYGRRGPIAGRRAASSMGLDAVLYDRSVPVVGFDLKTGAGSWSAARLAELSRRFGIPLVRIRVP